MPTVEVRLPDHRYPIVVEAGALERVGETVRMVAPHDRCALVQDVAVAERWGGMAVRSLAAAGYAVTAHRLPAGEAAKTLETVRGLYDVLLDARLERASPLIALGGGVTGDVVGFAAATYLRGVPFVQCPTTLLAMVDASVGGKVGVNVPQGKNLIGAFHQPVAVVADPRVLASLPEREMRCGLAECVKHGVIRDAGLVEFVDRMLDRIQAGDVSVLTDLVARNVAIKAGVVMEDEREAGVRAHLNFGHTFAHAIEATAGYGSVQHGEAVALGMVAATALAAELGQCDPGLVGRLRDLLGRIGLPVHVALASDDALLAAMRHDKKVASDRLRFVLPEALGRVTIRDDVPEQAVRAAFAAIRA